MLCSCPVARTPREKARQARNEVYRQHVLEAAEQVFAERGFEQAKVQEISKLAGLSMGTIYGLFPGKTELFRALLEDRGREVLDLVREVTARNGPARATLDALIELYVGYFVEHYRSEVSDLIATTVERWDTETTSRKVELQVGRDLQFIRINGTIVGGLAGVMIHFVGEFL